MTFVLPPPDAVITVSWYDQKICAPLLRTP